jgi:hypothetical protein
MRSSGELQGVEQHKVARQLYCTHNMQMTLDSLTSVLQKEATARQRQAALYGCTAVHAAFGDVELAQMTLRGGLQLGP